MSLDLIAASATFPGLATTGTQTFAGAKTFTGFIFNALGSLGTPTYSFTGDTDTGMWSSAGGFVNFSTDGVLGLTLSAGATSPVLRVGKQTNTPFSNAACLTLATGTGNSGRLATFCYDNTNPPLHISVGQGTGIPSIMWGALEQTSVNNTQIYALASTTTAKISSDASVARAFTLQVAPAGTINTQITWADALVVSSAGACTLGPATVTPNITHTFQSLGNTTVLLDGNTGAGIFAINSANGAGILNQILLKTAATAKWSVLSGQSWTGTSGLSADEFGFVRGDYNGTLVGKISTAGAWTFPLIHNIGSGNITSGTYTPTITNGTNVSANTPLVCNYSRIGNIVTVNGRVNITTTAAAPTASLFEISLPISSDFTASADAAGVGSRLGTGVAYSACIIYGSIANNTAVVKFNSQQTTSAATTFCFQYLVL